MRHAKRFSDSYIGTYDYADAGGMLEIETIRDAVKAVNKIAVQKDKFALASAKHNPDNDEYIATFRRSPRYYVKLQGRGPRSKPALAAGRKSWAFDQSLPLKYAERVDVYIYER
jgi:hypothetical protein